MNIKTLIINPYLLNIAPSFISNSELMVLTVVFRSSSSVFVLVLLVSASEAFFTQRPKYIFLNISYNIG